MMTRSALLEFWRSPTPDGNWPSAFIFPVWRSEVLARQLDGVAKDARILEVGCNSGRNLAHLTKLGYTNLQGLEINPHAVQLLRSTFPQLAGMPVHLGAAEDVLPELDGPYDLIFTLAVLEHVHPDSMPVVAHEIARLADQVLAIEPMYGHQSTRQHPHDLRRLFVTAGMTFVSADSFEGEHADFHDYAAWRFARRLA